MSGPDPYVPPTAATALDAKNSPLTTGEYLLLACVVLQVLFALRHAGVVLELVRTGAFSISYLLGFSLAVLLLAMGGALTFTRSPRSLYPYALAMMFSVLIFSTSPPVFAITSVAVSLGGCIISFIRATRRRK